MDASEPDCVRAGGWASSRGVDAGLALLCFLVWLLRFGSVGGQFDADVAIAGAMTLAPLKLSSLYQWGGQRQGEFIALVARPFVQFLHCDAGSATGVVTLACAAGGLYVALGFFRTLPWRVAFAMFCAVPSFAMARMLCQSHSYLPSTFLFALLAVAAFRRACKSPSAAAILWAATSAGLMIWAGDNAIILLPPQALALGIVGARHIAPRAWLRVFALSLAGLVAPAILIIVGKLHGSPTAEYLQLVNWREALQVFTRLAPQISLLAPQIGGTAGYVAIVALSLTPILLFRDLRLPRRTPSVLGLLGVVPMIGLVSTSFSRWFAANAYDSRYLALPIILAVLCIMLVGDAGANGQSGNPRLTRLVHGVSLAAALGVTLSTPFFCGDDAQRAWVVPHWRRKVDLAKTAGCQSVLAGYWEAYPYYALSRGTILASPLYTVRDLDLATRSSHATLVCVVPDRPDDRCPVRRREFGANLTLRDATRRIIDGEHVTYCRYSQAD